MKNIKFILLILLSFIYLNSFSQGCLVASNNNTVYTVQDNSALVNAVLALVFGGNPVYKPTPNEPSISVCVSNSQTVWVPTTQNCTVCPFGYSYNLGVINGCSTVTYVGKVANPTIVQCNLDDYSWALSIAAAGFGLIFIKKRKNL